MFSYYFCFMIEEAGAEPELYLILMDPDPEPGGPKTYMEDPDSQHCIKLYNPSHSTQIHYSVRYRIVKSP